ncbi:hypothetical protein Tco_1164844 [Tanacetum coccineum]
MIVTTSRTMPSWGGGRGKLVVVYVGLIVILSLACAKGFALSSALTYRRGLLIQHTLAFIICISPVDNTAMANEPLYGGRVAIVSILVGQTVTFAAMADISSFPIYNMSEPLPFVYRSYTIQVRETITQYEYALRRFRDKLEQFVAWLGYRFGTQP